MLLSLELVLRHFFKPLYDIPHVTFFDVRRSGCLPMAAWSCQCPGFALHMEALFLLYFLIPEFVLAAMFISGASENRQPMLLLSDSLLYDRRGQHSNIPLHWTTACVNL